MFVFEINLRPAVPDSVYESEQSDAYVTKVDLKDTFAGNLNRNSGLVQSSRFNSLSDRFRNFEIVQTNTVGLRRVEATDSGTGTRLGEIYGNKILANGEVIIVQQIGESDARMISFRRNLDDSEVAFLEKPHAPASPRSLGGLFHLLKPKPISARPAWVGQISVEAVDFRLILAASILLDADAH